MVKLVLAALETVTFTGAMLAGLIKPDLPDFAGFCETITMPGTGVRLACFAGIGAATAAFLSTVLAGVFAAGLLAGFTVGLAIGFDAAFTAFLSMTGFWAVVFFAGEVTGLLAGFLPATIFLTAGAFLILDLAKGFGVGLILDLTVMTGLEMDFFTSGVGFLACFFRGDLDLETVFPTGFTSGFCVFVFALGAGIGFLDLAGAAFGLAFFATAAFLTGFFTFCLLAKSVRRDQRLNPSLIWSDPCPKWATVPIEGRRRIVAAYGYKVF